MYPWVSPRGFAAVGALGEVVADARVTRFARWLSDRGVLTETYDDLWRWSVTEVDAFWDAIWAYFGVVGERGDGPRPGGRAHAGGGLTVVPRRDAQLRGERAAPRGRRPGRHRGGLPLGGGRAPRADLP